MQIQFDLGPRKIFPFFFLSRKLTTVSETEDIGAQEIQSPQLNMMNSGMEESQQSPMPSSQTSERLQRITLPQWLTSSS